MCGTYLKAMDQTVARANRGGWVIIKNKFLVLLLLPFVFFTIRNFRPDFALKRKYAKT